MIYVTASRLGSIKERWVGTNNGKKQHAFVLSLEWSDGSSSVVWRSYSDFFEFQCLLLDSFPEEAGSTRGFVRVIPYLPGRKVFRKSNLALAEERMPAIDSYIKELIKLPAKVSQSSVVVSFFQRRQNDPEWIQQFPQMINRLNEHGDSFMSMSENREGGLLQKTEDNIESFKDKLDNGQAAYINLTFEASEDLGELQ